MSASSPVEHVTEPSGTGSSAIAKGIAYTKLQINRMKDESMNFKILIDLWEAAWMLTLKTHFPRDMHRAVLCEAHFVLPLLSLKDHADFTIGTLEQMLPESERPYHPQEPEIDPLYHVRNRFR